MPGGCESLKDQVEELTGRVSCTRHVPHIGCETVLISVEHPVLGHQQTPLALTPALPSYSPRVAQSWTRLKRLGLPALLLEVAVRLYQ